MPAYVLTLSILGLLTAAAAFADFRTGHIPNPVVAVGAALGVALQIAVGVRDALVNGGSVASALASAVGMAALGIVLCAMVPLVLYRVGGMGGGDVKLLGAIGAVCGPMLGLEIEMTAFVVAMLYAGCRLAYRGQLLRLLGNSLALATNPVRPKEKQRAVPEELMTSLRFAPAVFAATVLTVAGHWSGP
jgi:prepilin peptidase CpaA